MGSIITTELGIHDHDDHSKLPAIVGTSSLNDATFHMYEAASTSDCGVLR